MLKAIFLDLDETLCPTSSSNNTALNKLSVLLSHDYPDLNVVEFCQRYIAGVYKKLNDELPQLLTYCDDEFAYRVALVRLLFKEQHIELSSNEAEAIQCQFDEERMKAFEFFPEIPEMLTRLQQDYKLVVITNGPAFSQRPKINIISLFDYADYILIGGEEPEEKPAASIFQKALTLVECEPHEVIHVGDSFECDIQGANAVNIASIWLTTKEQQEKTPLSHLASYVIYQPNQIEQTIKRHREKMNLAHPIAE